MYNIRKMFCISKSLFFLDAYIYIKENNLKKDTKTMKNLLSENMLRFGTKNLSEGQKRKLVLESVMETIKEHGLHNEVKRRLSEYGSGSGSIKGPKEINRLETPNLTAMKKTNPYLINYSTTLGKQFVQAAEGGMTTAGTNDTLMKSTLDSLEKYGLSIQKNYPDRATYLLSAVFGQIDATIKANSTTGYTTLAGLCKGELSGGSLINASKKLSSASAQNYDVSVNYQGWDGLLNMFGL
jgi:hypothetical protein